MTVGAPRGTLATREGVECDGNVTKELAATPSGSDRFFLLIPGMSLVPRSIPGCCGCDGFAIKRLFRQYRPGVFWNRVCVPVFVAYSMDQAGRIYDYHRAISIYD